MKIQAQELRIGNLVNDPYGSPTNVDIPILNYLDSCERTQQKNDRYSSIELTEEWLINEGGFEKFSSNHFERDDFWTIELKRNGKHKGMFRCNRLEVNIKSIHHLQNIYYDLNEKELCTQNNN